MDFSNSGSLQLKEFRCEKILVKHKCKYCDFTNDLWSILNCHIRRLHKTSPDYRKPDLQIQPYPCSNCDFISYSLLVWKLHKNKCNNVSEDENKSAKTSWKFSQSGSLKQQQQHISIKHHRENLVLYKCNKCSFKTAHKAGFKCHKEIRHAKPKDSQWYECDRCDYKTKNKYVLQEHISVKHFRENLVEFKCSQCSFKTVYNRNLKSHINAIHARKNEFKCNKCFFKSAYKNGLKNHMNAWHAVFKEIKWFECSQCEYKANKKRTLGLHFKQKHAPENLIYYECYDCSYRTTFKQYLERHIVSRHTLPENINWFKCDHCKFKAKRKSNLQDHIKRKHAHEDLVQP